MATMPISFSTALYALSHRAKLSAGETVLIHSAAGGLGLAAIQVSKLVRARIFATVGSEVKKKFLVENHGLNPNHIFNSRNVSSFVVAATAATNGRGFDVVLNSLSGEHLHESWRLCTEFGRFIEVGKRDIIEYGRLDMEVFKRATTFTAFDLTSLYYSENRSQNQIWRNLLHETVSLYRSGKIDPIQPLRIFPVSEFLQAFHCFSSSNRIGKIAVTLESPKLELKVRLSKFSYRFNKSKCYIMVGCLGGIGSSLSRWMLERGARSFLFLGRSGTDKRAAQDTVNELRDGGASVQLVRGDVCCREDVRRAFTEPKIRIGGVIQAAMALKAALFSKIPRGDWLTAIQPKVDGSWNLHNELQALGKDQLDFFILVSSVSGSIGSATESNYCAANAFQDSFARHRRSFGLPTISIGLGMVTEVGYLRERPELQAVFRRKGLHPITEDELLQTVDVALTSLKTRSGSSANFRDAHILTGFEDCDPPEECQHGNEGDNYILDDPRGGVIKGALERSKNASNAASRGSGDDHNSSISAALASGKSVLEAVEEILCQKISNLILVPLQELHSQTNLSSFGLDSMLAAELRTSIYQTFDADVPYLVLLSTNASIRSLSETIIANGKLSE